jgi:predicted metal-dependent phosphoesterase TrpH
MSAQMLIQLKAENEALKARVAEQAAAKEIAALIAENAQLKALLSEDDDVAVVEEPKPKKVKKEKKVKSTEPKEKKAPSAWCDFSARVVKIVRASGWTGKQTLIWTVASSLKKEKGYDCTDDDIMAAWAEREPPPLTIE